MILKDNRVYTSYSQLQKFLQCPYSWKLRYVDKITDEMKSKHLDYGNIVHSTLEFIFDFVQSFCTLPPIDTAYQMLEDNFISYDLQCDSPVEYEEWTDRACDMIDMIYQQEGIYDLILSSEIVGVELPFTLKVDIMEREFTNNKGEMLETDTVEIIGFIDLVLKTDDGYIVIDHKSGNNKFDKKKLRTDLQFPIYAIAINEMFGEYPIKGIYNFTKLGIYQEVLFSEEVTIEMNEMMDKRSPKQIYFTSPNDALMQIRQIFNDMFYGQHKAIPSFYCRFCDYQDICPSINHNT